MRKKRRRRRRRREEEEGGGGVPRGQTIARANNRNNNHRYAAAYVRMGLTSCWGDTPDPKQHTTYSARTFLQPQLNKAAKKDELVRVSVRACVCAFGGEGAEEGVGGGREGSDAQVRALLVVVVVVGGGGGGFDVDVSCCCCCSCRRRALLQRQKR